MQHLVDLITEFWNGGGLDIATKLYAENAVRIDPILLAPSQGPREIATYLAGVQTAFPDFKFEIEQSIADGDRLVTQWRTSGTHLGVFLGIPPTGKWVEMSGVGLVRIENGKVAEERAYFDRLSLLEQLGIGLGAPQGEAKSARQ